MTLVLDMTSPAVQSLIESQRRFDATRPPCPSWCDGTCETHGHFGDAVIHTETPAEVRAVADWNDVSHGTVTVKAWRHDSLTEASTAAVILDVSAAETATGDYAVLTAQQARQLSAELLRSASMIDPQGGTR